MPTIATRARFAHKIDRQWQKGAPAPMPKRWRTVCGIALAMAPQSADDPKFHRAVVRHSASRARSCGGSGRASTPGQAIPETSPRSRWTCCR